MRNSKGISGAVSGGWNEILSRIPRSPRALRRRGQECLAAGNISQANRLADRLAKIDPWRGTHLRGEILLHEQPYQDHTDFWAKAAARFPEDADLVRKTIHAALKAGKAEIAEAGLRTLMDGRRTRAHDSNFVVGLANIYSSRADGTKIRPLVRRYMRSLRGKPDYTIAGVRLSRIIFAFFPRKRTDAADGDAHNAQFLTMLERSAVRENPKSILRRVIALERELATRAPPALFDTDISKAQCRKFIVLVRDSLANGRNFSFIRVGDGESSCLVYEPSLSDFAQADTGERERLWWGAELGASDRARISRQISSAIWNADCLGVPTVARILRDVRLSEDDELGASRVGRGLRSILYTFENAERFDSREPKLRQFTSCHLHQDLARWDLYPELFEASREVVLISCHPGLAEVVRQRFGVRVVGDIVVPPRFASIPLLRHRPQPSRFLPEIVEEVAEQLGELPRNRLVLVGAGYLGKWLVEQARMRGGVALDLGSILDQWVGVSTRSYLDLAPN